MKKPNVILVLYRARGVYPLRDAIATHLYCWQRYSSYRFIYVNTAFGIPWRWLRHVRLAGIIYHTVFLSARWAPEIFAECAAMCAPLVDLDLPKIAMPQDEFIYTGMLGKFLAGQRITHLLTCAEEPSWRKIYGEFLDFDRVKVRTVLTGYIDERSAARIGRMKRVQTMRHRDIGYRAWRAAYWLGEHGQHKVRIAEAIVAAAARRNLRFDVSQSDEDVLLGDDWFRFMLDCRAIVGVEGGASVLDHDGSIKAATEAYLAQHPGASFAETRAACFPGRDGELDLACISPRHLEACLTETGQILVEGDYNGILQRWRHYVPVKRDYSDVEQALDALQDPAVVQRLVKSAYEDIVASGRWSYRRFVGEVEAEIFDCVPLARMDIPSWFYYLVFRARDWLSWRRVQLEVVVYRGKDRSFLGKYTYVTFRWLRSIARRISAISGAALSL